MKSLSIDAAREDIAQLAAGDSVFFQDPGGRVRKGAVRIKPVRCGKKNCKACPHHIYAYARYRIGEKVTEKYIGKVR